MPIDDIPHRPDAPSVRNLVRLIREVITSSDAVTSALLLSRPGRGRPTNDDLDWARVVTEAVEGSGVPMRPMHLATEDGVQPMPHDLLRTG